MINENIRLVAGAARRWRLSLVREDSSPVDLSAYRFYGGAASRYRKEFRTMETVSTAPDEVILQLPPLPYGERWHHQIYMQDSATSREWLILSGSIDVLERLGEDAAASTIAEAESYLRCTLSSTTDELEGTFLEAGPRGPQGEQGPKGDKGDPLTYDDLTAEQKAELIAPLGYAEVDVAPEGTTEDNYNAYGFGFVMPRAGRIKGLTLECRDAGTATPADTPIWLKVWRGTTLIARSDQGQQHALDAVLSYTFAEPFEVAEGEEIKVSFHAEEGLAETGYYMGGQCCLRVVAKDPDTPGGMLGAAGGYGEDSDPTQRSWQAKHTWHMLVGVFAPAEHVEDMAVHITADEHAGLAELLETYGTTGRDVPILNGEAIVQVGHTYVITATGAVTGSCGEAQLTCAAGKQLGFVATTTTATLNGSCSLTELFRPAAAVQLSGAGGGEPEGDYVTVAADSTLTGGRLDALTSGRYLQYERSTLTSWDIPMPSLITGDHMFYKCTALAGFTSNLTSLQEGSYMFSYSGLTSFACELPSLTSAVQMFCACSALRSFDVDLPALTKGNQMFQSSGLQSFTGALPALQTALQMFDRCGLRVFSVDLPELQSGSNMFIRCASLQSFSSYLPLMTGGGSMFSSCTALTSFAADLPSLSTGSNMFSSCKLDKASALRVLTTIPTYTSDTHNLTIGIHVDHQTDEEVLAAITAAEGKGWTLTVQWNGTATA